jgi:ParB family chromosome partitioning protein
MTKIALDLIERGDRLRAACPEQVAALADSIALCGLISPITVYARDVIRAGIAVPGYGLVAGLHRLEAVESLGLVDIDAHVVGLDDLHRQLAECDENLCSAKLSKADLAIFTARRKMIYEAINPETRHGAIGNGRAKSCQVGDSTPTRFTADTATRTGRSERDVARDAARGERITREALEAVRGTDADKGVVLDALARMPQSEQAAEARRLAEMPRVRPAPAVLNEYETEELWRAALIRVWNRGSQEWRERVLPTLDAPVFDRTAAR